jgi:hypothetical protein
MRACPLLVVLLSLICMFSTSICSARAEQKTLESDTRFCPTWAEAHERTLASLNNGRPPFPVHWKGCITLKRGTQVDVVDQDEGFLTEIVVKGRHWFADE